MTFVCANCGNGNPDGSAYCNKCGAKIGESPQPSSLLLRKCPRCAMWNDLDRPLCVRCGEGLTSVDPVTVSTAQSFAARYCAWCGAGVGVDEKFCPVCRRDPSGHTPRVDQDKRIPPVDLTPAHSLKPAIAGVLLIGAGILELAAAFRAWTADFSGVIVPANFDLPGFVAACGTIIFTLGLIALIGSYSAFSRNSFLLAITASIAGMLGLGYYSLGSVLSFIALILIVISRDEFRRR